MTGLVLNSDSWFGVIRWVGVADVWLSYPFPGVWNSHHPSEWGVEAGDLD